MNHLDNLARVEDKNPVVVGDSLQSVSDGNELYSQSKASYLEDDEPSFREARTE